MQQLLATKLFIPGVRPGHVVRGRLLDLLDGATYSRLILLAAPAGSGKTSLLSEWLRGGALAPAAAWLSLGPEENDPVRFWRDCIGALQTVDPRLGQGALAALEAPQPPALATVVDLVLGDLVGFGRDLVIIFDDYHVVSALAVHETVGLLLEHLPPQVRLAVVTRADPPLPLSRLRARGQLTEIRAADLAFTGDEAAALLRDAVGIRLASEQVSALEARTEGWAAGLQLAALSLKGAPDVQRFVAAFAGSHRFVLDYLADEVLGHLPFELLDFLVRTAVLEQVCGSLCDAVTGGVGGQGYLERCERDGLFVVPLDGERHWYRYHHMFRDVLRARLLQEQPGMLPDLHRRAARWYGREGFAAEAFAHALAAGDILLAADLAEQHATGLMTRGETATLLSWLKSLPAETLRERPRLSVYMAWACAMTGQVSEAESWLEVGLVSPEPLVAGYGVAVRAYVWATRGAAGEAARLARQALDLLPEAEDRMRCMAAFVLGSAAFMTGDLEAAAAGQRLALDLGRKAGNSHIIYPVLASLSSILAAQGRLDDAEACCREALRWAAERGEAASPVLGRPLVALSEVLYQRNDLDGALQAAEDGLARDLRWGNPMAVIYGYVALARIRAALGQVDEASRLIGEAESFLRERKAGPPAELALALARIRMMEPGEAAALLARMPVLPPELGYLAARRAIAAARVDVLGGRVHSALDLLAAEAEKARGSGRVAHLIEVLVLQSSALSRLGRGPKPPSGGGRRRR